MINFDFPGFIVKSGFPGNNLFAGPLTEKKRRRNYDFIVGKRERGGGWRERKNGE